MNSTSPGTARRNPGVVRSMAALATSVALVAAACSGSTSGEPQARPSTTQGEPRIQARPASGGLQPFDGCDDLIDYVRDEATPRIGAQGLDGSGAEFFAAGEEIRAGAALPATGGPVEGNDLAAAIPYSTTNIQEQGIDEPDTVKTDGERLLAAVNGVLHYLDLTGDEPVIAGSLALEGGWGHQLLLAGDRAFVLASGAGVIEPQPRTDELSIAPVQETTVISEVDIGDPASLSVVSTQTVEGRLLSARVVDGVAHVVVRTRPNQVDFVYPSGPGAEEIATETNKRIVEESEIEQWLPRIIEGQGDDQSDPEPVVDCSNVAHPTEYSGLGMLSVLSIDLGEPLGTPDAVSVMADGETVYASASSLYVATNEWVDPIIFQEDQLPPDASAEEIQEQRQEISEEYKTSIHKFDLTGGRATYVASGSVQGHLLNQFALSEHEGILRVATTAGVPWGFSESSESFVVTLEQDGDELVQLGQVGGMGKTEQIHSVRFIGDTGYVVTFRQTDPLYVVDLSDPANPTVAGELEIPGYSAYLHPAGEGRLIGVGQDATDEGRPLGTQVSLFDVSDPSNPTRLHQYSFGSGSSAVEWDHHAFLWWPDDQLAVVPISVYNQGTPFAGAVGLEISDAGISERGRIAHEAGGTCGTYEEIIIDDQGNEVPVEAPIPCDAFNSEISRSVVVGDTLVTISAAGFGVNDLSTFGSQGFTAWG